VAQRIVSGIMMVGLLICLGTTVHAQALKIGFVNSAKILQEYPEAIDANKKLDAMQKKWQADLEKMSKDLQSQIEDYQKKEPLLKDDEKKSRQADLSDQQQKVLQYQKEKFGNDGALAIATDSLLRPIKQKVIKVIGAIAQEKHIQFMFDRNDQIMVLLYGEPKFDYTNLVIDRLTRGNE